jgi:outer membrane beta-barrel protein
MESRTGLFLLTRAVLLAGVLTFSVSGCAWLKNIFDRDKQDEQEEVANNEDDGDAAPPRVIDPEIERREIKRPKIDTENFEIGAYYGSMTVEDFGTNPSYGVKAAYHVTEDFFFEANYGQTTLGKTSFELLNPAVDPLNLGSGRRFTYYALSVGYNFLPGEVFIGRKLAMNSAFYLSGGIGSVRLGGEDEFALNFGAGYRVLPNDWLTVYIDVQDRVYNSDIFGTKKLTNNLEARIGVTVFF